MEILNNFGFEPLLFIAQIVNFLLLFLIFAKYLYKPILKVLKEREKKIKQSLKDAEEAQTARDEAEKTRDEVIKKAGREAEEIMSQTKKTAEELREDILNKARQEAERIISDGKKQADVAMDTMEKRAKEASLEVSQKILDKVLAVLLSKNEKETVMKRSMEMLKEYE